MNQSTKVDLPPNRYIKLIIIPLKLNNRSQIINILKWYHNLTTQNKQGLK